MEQQHEEARDSLYAARQHIQALTSTGGVSRQALLRVLLEQETAQAEAQAAAAYLTPIESPSLFTEQIPIGLDMSGQSSQGHSHWSMSSAGSPATMMDQYGYTTTPLGGISETSSMEHFQQDRVPSFTSMLGHNARTSVSTTASGSVGRASIMSTATTMSSLSSGSRVTQFPGPGVMTSTSEPAPSPFWCTCCGEPFKRKFDWKRHEDEFHERYKRYPCNQCNRVFWGANSFNQHHKSRHGCTTCPHADRVIVYTRRKRAWGCGFCAAFLPSMDRYFEHVGKHFDAGKTREEWLHSRVVYGLLHQPGVTEAWKRMWKEKYGGLRKEEQPSFSWNKRTTGRSQGFLERESPGQLQDLLEFFDKEKEDAGEMARLAFKMAEVVMPQDIAADAETEAAMMGVLKIRKHTPPVPEKSRPSKKPGALEKANGMANQIQHARPPRPLRPLHKATMSTGQARTAPTTNEIMPPPLFAQRHQHSTSAPQVASVALQQYQQQQPWNQPSTTHQHAQPLQRDTIRDGILPYYMAAPPGNFSELQGQTRLDASLPAVPLDDWHTMASTVVGDEMVELPADPRLMAHELEGGGWEDGRI